MSFGNTVRFNKFGVSFVVVVLLFLIMYSLKTRKEYSKDTVELRKLLTAGFNAAVEGGYKVYAVFNTSNFNTKSKGKTKEGANNPVTDADLMSHCMMYYSLKQSFPRIKIISEEKDKDECDNQIRTDILKPNLEIPIDLPDESALLDDVTIWIDPLDATQEFTEKLVEYVTTMVCVAVKGMPTLGIIHFPFSKTTVWSWVGHGSNIKYKQVNEKVVVITSRSHKGDVSSLVKQALRDNYVILQAGGAGYKSTQVASGNATVYVHTTEIKKWDICAGDAVLQTLGGKMTNLLGEDINYGSTSDNINKYGLVAALGGHSDVLKQLMNAYESP